jgi:WD40 repeat protein
LQRFQGDFSAKEASLNQCVLSFDNRVLATAGDDSVVRVYHLAEDFKSVSSKLELRNCGDQPQTSVDLSRDNSMLVVASKDASAYIVDLKSQKVLQ